MTERKLLNMKALNITVSVAIVIFSIIYFWIYSGTVDYYSETVTLTDYYTADVMTISEVENQDLEISNGDVMRTVVVSFVAQITSGDMKGQTVAVTQYHDDYLHSALRTVEVGDKIIVNKAATGDVMTGEWIMANYNRIGLIIATVVIFFIIVVLIGRLKGVAAIVSLILTLGAVFMVYIPSILAGMNIYLITSGVAVYIVVMSLILLNGLNSKTFCAVAGNLVGITVAGVLSYFANNIFMISGIITQDHIYLATIGKELGFTIIGVVWSGVVIGALGAIMDVSMSLSSSMHELSKTMESPTRFKLIKSGLNIGHDIIGTMMNTLVLAYVGSSIVEVLLIMIYNKTALTMLNAELVLVEILQAIVGSIGILLTVPFTVLICSVIFHRVQNNDKKGIPTVSVEKQSEPNA